MADMCMIEDAKGNISWICSSCEHSLKDKNNFEGKVKECPNCKEKVINFHSLYDENGDYVDG
jgi:rubrerythrin